MKPKATVQFIKANLKEAAQSTVNAFKPARKLGHCPVDGLVRVGKDNTCPGCGTLTSDPTRDARG